MGEANQADAIFETAHTVAVGSKLFGNGAVADYDTRDGRGVVRAYEHTAWLVRCGSQIRGGIVSEGRDKNSRETEETDAIRMVGMAPSVKEADLGVRAGQRTVREDEGGVAGRTSHGSVVGVSKDGTRVGVIGFGKATKQEAGGVNGEGISRCVEGGASLQTDSKNGSETSGRMQDLGSALVKHISKSSYEAGKEPRKALSW